MKQYFVYMITNKKYGVLYIGVTSDLVGRLYQHREKSMGGFSKKYQLNLLVYYEIHEDPTQAILREKQLKKWKREWKIELIETMNANWADLTASIC